MLNIHRVLNPYEQNHLRRHGIDFTDLTAFVAKYGEMPVEYITGHVEFDGLDFLVTPDTLIPRIETEELVNLASAEIDKRATAQSDPNEAVQGSTLQIADVGTGSGAVAICLARNAAQAGYPVTILASDVSEAALGVARDNWQRLAPDHAQSSKVQFVQSDLFAAYPARTQFDVIVANLPYIPSERITVLDESVKDFEPHVALDGGEDGLYLIMKLLEQAGARLKKDGVILLELDYTHNADAWRGRVPNWHVELIDDQFSRTRFARVRRPLLNMMLSN